MRLPINPILYLVTSGLVGGAAWQFYQAYEEKDAFRVDEMVKTFRDGVERGEARQPDAKDWRPGDYSQVFASANLTGKVAPKATVATEQKEPEKPPAPPQIPITDIIKIQAVIHERLVQVDDSEGPKNGNGGDGVQIPKNQTGVLVLYVDPANVQPPPEVVAARANGAAPVYSAPQSSRVGRSRNKRAGRGQVTAPINSGGAPLTQFIYLYSDANTLWPPYDNIKLVRVDESCGYGVFARSDPSDPEKTGEDEKIYKEELQAGLNQKVLAALDRLSGGEKATVERRPTRPAQPVPVAANTGIWRGGDTTRRFDNGEVHLGKDLARQFGSEPDRILSQAGLRSYRSGSVRGVQVTRVPPQLTGVGLQADDVILELNGQKVSSESQAYSVGKRLYQGGERVFKAKILSNGRVREETFLAPRN